MKRHTFQGENQGVLTPFRHDDHPQVQAFVACRKITTDPATGEILDVGPTSRAPTADFPAVIRLAV